LEQVCWLDLDEKSVTESLRADLWWFVKDSIFYEILLGLWN
jgi:hypothetical protein